MTALHNRPVRMPRFPDQPTPWNRDRGRTNRLIRETNTLPDYPEFFLLEDDEGNGRSRILLENA